MNLPFQSQVPSLSLSPAVEVWCMAPGQGLWHRPDLGRSLCCGSPPALPAGGGRAKARASRKPVAWTFKGRDSAKVVLKNRNIFRACRKKSSLLPGSAELWFPGLHCFHLSNLHELLSRQTFSQLQSFFAGQVIAAALLTPSSPEPAHMGRTNQSPHCRHLPPKRRGLPMPRGAGV